MDLFDTLAFVEILVRTTFLGILSLTVPRIYGSSQNACTVFTHFQEAMRGGKGEEKEERGV
jgi:hypothetical protein